MHLTLNFKLSLECDVSHLKRQVITWEQGLFTSNIMMNVTHLTLNLSHFNFESTLFGIETVIQKLKFMVQDDCMGS